MLMSRLIRFSLPLQLAILFSAPAVFAATFVVPTDADMVHRAHAIVIATPLTSYTQPTSDGGIETVTPMRVEEVIKGGRLVGQTLNVFEPGGEYQGRAMLIAGVPRFNESTRMLLFLARVGTDRWAVTELVLGKFTFRDTGSAKLLVRDEDEIIGWDPDLTPHHEQPRDAARFLDFVRAESRGAAAASDYFVSAPATTTTAPLTTSRISASTMATATPTIAPYSATSYTMVISGSMGGRWAIFPNAVNFFSGTTQEPGAPGGGTTAITTAFASWNNDCASNVNYVYAGTDNGSHTQGLHAADGANTILFERDLSAWGIAPFTCSSGGYSGTLGIGGITSASGTNTVNGETFATTQEADVEMNRGIANCSLLFNNGDFNSAVTHEVGHTLGFRHSDQTRDSSGACTNDPSLECSNQAIMKAFITTGLNAALQAWDQHAVQAVYPGNVCAPTSTPTCTPPAITSQPASTTINSGSSATLTVTASGTAPLSYQWFTGPSGTTTTPVSGGTGPSITVSPTTTTSYWVRVTNSCGSANSSAATVTVNTTTTTTGRAKPYDLNGDGKADIFWWQPQSGETSAWLMNGFTKTSSAYVETAPLAWHPVAVGDFDGDGKVDILLRNFQTGENSIWFMNGLVKRLGAFVESAPLVWSVKAVADFNGDGKADILWRNDSTGENSMWLMNGATKQSSAYLESAPTNWKVAGAADFNGDGRADIFWRDPQSGLNSMWLMNGFTKTSSSYVETVPTAWSVAGFGDFDGDGRADILWRDQSGLDSIWLMNGFTKSSSAYVESAPTNWNVVEIGDFNGDGLSDILWRDPSSGANSLWLMNTFTKTSSAYLESAPPPWQVIR
jgi:hypothetical protein